MKKNLYIECRKWVGFWGIFLDSEKEVQKVLDKHNAAGYHCVQFEIIRSKFNLIQLILISIVSLLTLGFFSYWQGFAIIFEKDFSVENMDSTSNNRSEINDQSASKTNFEKWKKANPKGILNDFYREINKS